MKRTLLAVMAAAGAAALACATHRTKRRRRDFSLARSEILRFPPGFHFGAATAAHQVEGGNTRNIWARWERATRPDGRPAIRTGARSGRAADHWRRFDEDLGRMQDLGLTMYRFSIEWSRIEPEEGRFDDRALARYRRWCEQLRAAGIAPMVTLHHFTEPLWLTPRPPPHDANPVPHDGTPAPRSENPAPRSEK